MSRAISSPRFSWPVNRDVAGDPVNAALLRRWNAFWFQPSPALGLAACRVLFFAAFSGYYLRLDFRELADLPSAIWQPVWPFRALGVELPGAATLILLSWLWRTSMFTACLGVFTRLSTALALALGVYLIGLTENVARINHSDAIVIWGLIVMACSRCGDVLSVDAWLGRVRSRPSVEQRGDYTWPIRVMWLVFVVIYFAAGVTKLATSGLAWATSDHLANLLMLGPVAESPLTKLGQEVGRHPLMSSLLAGLTLGLELSAPLALISRGARRTLIPAIFLMQFSIRALLGPGFTEFFICGLFWIPWDAVYLRFSSPRVRRPAAAPVHV